MNDDQNKIKKFLQRPEILEQIDAIAKLNPSIEILKKMSHPVKDLIEQMQKSKWNIYASTSLLKSYQDQVEELQNLFPHYYLIQEMDSTLRNPLLESYQSSLSNKLLEAQKAYAHIFHEQPEYNHFEKLIKSTSHITEILISNKNLSQQMEEIQPILPSIASIMNSPIAYFVPNDVPDYVFNVVTSSTDSLAESLVKLKKSQFLHFGRITEKNIKALFDDSNLFNHISYMGSDGALGPQLLIQDKDGNSYSPDVHKDRKSLNSFLPDLEPKEILDFVHHLGSFLLLGLYHPVGKALFSELEKSWENHIEEIASGETFFRSRLNELDCPIPPQKMFDPPYGVANIGRFNWHGINHLYLADSLKTTKAELNHNQNKQKGITSIKADNREPLRVFNLNEEKALTFSHCLFEDSAKENNHHTYFLPNFISQCLCWLITHKNINLDGIKYLSKKKLPEKLLLCVIQ